MAQASTKAEKVSVRLTRNPSLTDFDIAVGMNETLFSDFLDAHHKRHYPGELYKGGGTAQDIDIQYSWDIDTAAKVYIGQIPPSDLKKGADVVFSELRAACCDSAEKTQKAFEDNPPDVKIHFPHLVITLRFSDGGVETVIDIPLDFTVLANVEYKYGLVKFIPVAAFVGDPDTFSKRLTEEVTKHKSLLESKRVSNCDDFVKLFKHMVNALLAQKLSAFVLNLEIPTSIQLVSGVALGNILVNIVPQYLVLTADAYQIGGFKDFHSPNNKYALQDLALTVVTNNKLQKHKPIKTKSVAAKLSPDANGLPDTPFYVLFAQHFFQVLADTHLVRILRDKFEGKSGDFRWDGNFELLCLDPKTSISGPSVKFRPLVSASVTDGDVWWKKIAHCTFDGTVDVLPDRRITVNVDFPVDEHGSIAAHAQVEHFKAEADVDFGGWCSIGESCVNDKLEDEVDKYQAKHPLDWTTPTIVFPEAFPGTDFKYVVTLNPVANVQGRLAFTGSIDFQK